MGLYPHRKPLIECCRMHGDRRGFLSPEDEVRNLEVQDRYLRREKPDAAPILQKNGYGHPYLRRKHHTKKDGTGHLSLTGKILFGVPLSEERPGSKSQLRDRINLKGF